ncbi:MAG TPA: ComEC/Rec2 family competence protein [Candidatus Saccharimonadales bacterium]|nr:ComEC/Rec2 family competence protein [Candidatus Saccharimonadales bacterium]
MWKWNGLRRVNRTTILMVGCGAFLAGLVAARRIDGLSGWVVLGAAGVAVAALRRRTGFTMLLVLIAGLGLGIWRGDAYLQRMQPYRALAHRKVTFQATANIDAVYGKNSQLSLTVRDVQFESPERIRVPGMIKVSGFGEMMVYHGDRLEVSGSLYPTRGAAQASVGFAELHRLSSGTSPIDTLRRKFAAGLQSVLPEPLASFGMGLLVGQRNTLPADLTQTLLMVGLTHIIAVSGYNLTILLQASRRLLGERSKRLSVAAALALIFGFLLIAGDSASIVRAAVISIMGLMAWYYGRSVRPVLLILLAAAGTAYANPVYLWADISWYLSFLAFFGIMVLGPVITRKFYGEKEPPLLVGIALESICAEIMTLPVILYIFGQMSLVSLLANVLVVALIPLAMLLSFVAGLAGMLIGNVAGWFAWPANILLTYMLDVVRLLSRIPHVFQQDRYLSVLDMVFCYLAVVGLVWISYRKRRRGQHALLSVITDKLAGSTYTGRDGRETEIRSISAIAEPGGNEAVR